jgi:hypothetical protein
VKREEPYKPSPYSILLVAVEREEIHVPKEQAQEAIMANAIGNR